MNIVRLTKGKNIIFSSGAHSDIDHRAPFDVVCMWEFFYLFFFYVNYFLIL